jgi:hypothetical protein
MRWYTLLSHWLVLHLPGITHPDDTKSYFSNLRQSLLKEHLKTYQILKKAKLKSMKIIFKVYYY